jgi:hypothetical protein
MSAVFASLVPEGSLIARRLPGANFQDAWSVEPADPGLCALEYDLKAAQATPAWVNHLMSVRNRVVAQMGLKDLGHLGGFNPDRPLGEYQVGDRIGIFTLLENQADEVVLGDTDKHLDVALSVHLGRDPESDRALLTVSTVVHIHNLLGRLYMLPVAPVHKLIVPSVMLRWANGAQ